MIFYSKILQKTQKLGHFWNLKRVEKLVVTERQANDNF